MGAVPTDVRSFDAVVHVWRLVSAGAGADGRPPSPCTRPRTATRPCPSAWMVAGVRRRRWRHRRRRALGTGWRQSVGDGVAVPKVMQMQMQMQMQMAIAIAMEMIVCLLRCETIVHTKSCFFLVFFFSKNTSGLLSARRSRNHEKERVEPDGPVVRAAVRTAVFRCLLCTERSSVNWSPP